MMAFSEQVSDDNLETFLAKATNPLHKEPDKEAVEEFSKLIDRDRDGPQVALRLLAHKIQSPIEKESLMALCVLECCVKQSGSRFRSELGKFRFLNEMIKVVSPKYLGNRAPVKVKQKIIELMFLWSMELKNESKIFEAYQMLKRQGVVLEDPIYILDNYEPLPPPPPRTSKVPIFEDEENAQQLQKLLRSKNPEDLQAANRLIKNMVREADKRMELMAKRSTEIETVHNNASVLADMLSHYRHGETSAEEQELMKELFDSCERLRPKLFRLAGELDEKDEGLNDILKANDELTVVINSYKKVMGISSENGTPKTVEASLLDLGSPVDERVSCNSSLLDDQLLALGLEDVAKLSTSVPVNSDKMKTMSACTTASSTSLADLNNIFSVSSIKSESSSLNVTSSVINPVIGSNCSNNRFFHGSGDIPSLTPISTSIVQSSNPAEEVRPNVHAPSKGLEELDELGKLMLKESLPSSHVKLEFPSTPQKVPLSQLMQQNKTNAEIPSNPKALQSTSASKTLVPEKVSPSVSPSHSTSKGESPLKDIFIPLESVQPGTLLPLNLYEKNGLTLVIHFGKDSPRADITVMVVCTMSKNSNPVKNINFQAAVPKSMKIKLQPPSATDLPSHNPILPLAAITQVMLLSNPQKENVRFKYKISYNINGEDCTDVGEVDSLLSPR